MNKSEYILQSFGLSAKHLQDGITDQIVKQVAVKIKELSQLGDVSCLIDITKQLHDVVGDVKYSPIWVMILDGLSHFSHLENVQAVHQRLMEEQVKTFNTGSLPRDILHKLWLTHLPSLESAVMTLVYHICSDEHLPHTALIQESLRKSLLVEIASREHVIYQTVYRMLMSLILSSDFAVVMVEITANFCCMVRCEKTKPSFQNELKTSGLRRSTERLRAFLTVNCDPKSMSSTSVGSTVCQMYQLWTNNRQKSTELPKSLPLHADLEHHTKDQQFEELWHLTVEYRDWITAALHIILSCDELFVEPCLWLIAAHHHINLSSQKFKPLQDTLTQFVDGLREYMHSYFQESEQTSQMKGLTEKTFHALESRALRLLGETETHQRTVASLRCVVNQILMAFFFQSDAGLSIGDELLMLVTSSTDVFVHARCLIYHYYFFGIATQHWNSAREDWFLSLVTGLRLRLQQEQMSNSRPDFLHLHNQLKSLFPRD